MSMTRSDVRKRYHDPVSEGLNAAIRDDIAEAIDRAYARGHRDGYAEAKCNEWKETI